MITSENGQVQPAPKRVDPETLEKAKRRQFSADDKRRYLREYEATPKGERGAFLRRHGLYSSHIDTWRKQAAGGELGGLEPRKRGRKPKPRPDPELERLRRDNARLQRQLAHAEKILDVQKKLSEILGIPLNPPESDESE